MRASGVVICSLKVRGCLAASAGVVTRSVKVRVRWLQVRVCGNPVFKCACLAAGAGVAQSLKVRVWQQVRMWQQVRAWLVTRSLKVRVLHQVRVCVTGAVKVRVWQQVRVWVTRSVGTGVGNSICTGACASGWQQMQACQPGGVCGYYADLLVLL